MSKKTTYLLGLLTTLIVGFFLHRSFCCTESCKKVIKAEEIYPKKATTPFLFNFKAGAITIRNSDGFNFLTSGHTLRPLSEDLLTSVEKMIAYLGKNKDKKLNITGYFRENENNPSNFENLGFARSTAIKNLLIEHGLSPRQVSVSSKKDNTLNANKDKIIDRGFAFSVENLKNSGGNSKKIRAMVEHISKDPVLVRFLPAKFNAVLYNEEKHKLKTLANFLNASDSLSCTIVGHTDSSWNHESNMSLGKKRAEFTKIKLIEYNVDASKIKTISKGETSPIASNLTEKGKAMNRRTEVIIN